MTTTTEPTAEEAFWVAIGAAPEDQLPRLVFADWLEERAKVVECKRCGGRGVESVYERGEYGPNRYQQDCPTCKGTGYIPDRNGRMAAALRATVKAVPWVKVFKLGFGWWCRRAYHDDHHDEPNHLIERPLMNAMSDSNNRCDRDDSVRFDKRDGVSGGVILFPTAAAAIRDLCEAYIKVTYGEVRE